MAECSIYKRHVPEHPATDSHHVIPQAWQVALKGALFDRRTVEVCPNCHRGVHQRIVALMLGRPAGRDRLWPVAKFALDRFVAAGGSLEALRAAGKLGQQ